MIADTQDQILQQLVHHPALDSLQLQAQLHLTNEALYAELVSLVALNYIALENKKIVRVVLTA
jgi:hypothetical protein